MTGGPYTLQALAPRAVATLGVVGICALLLRERLADIRLADVTGAIGAIPSSAMLGALALGILSHLALAGYDLLAMTRIARHVPWPRALRGGFAGTVMSQVIGFGIVSGSFARARIYRANGITVTEAVALTGFVAAGFFLGLTMLLAILALIDTAPAMAVTGAQAWAVRVMAALLLATAVAAAWATARRSFDLRLGHLTLRVPDGKWLASATTLAAADLVPAALCLAMLLPETGMPGFAAFVAIYITAVALGHVIGSPGAAGPFEGILFLALPGMGAAELAAGILMYRLIYYMPPFALAVWFVAGTRRAPDTVLLTGKALRDRIDWVVDSSDRAEAELTFLGDKHVFMPQGLEAFVPYGISGRIWLVMGDPIGPRTEWPALIDAFRAEARAQGAAIAVYKATEAARPFWAARGWAVQPLGQEALVEVTAFSLGGSDRRELRRKLRTVEKAGIRLDVHAPGNLPLDAMAPVARAWHDAKGHEQGFSMGRWEPRFNARHWAVTAWDGDDMTAFATFWTSGDGREWMLDLMRQHPEAANGTMHAVLARAAEQADAHGAHNLNLCMAPLSGLQDCPPVTALSRLGQHVYETRNQQHGLQGMRRFKQIFSPDWTARYAAAPDWATLVEALFAAQHLVNGSTDPATRNTARTPLLALPAPPPMLQDAEQQDNTGETLPDLPAAQTA